MQRLKNNIPNLGTTGFVLGICFWILESVLHTLFWGGGSFLGQLATSEVDEIWMRLVVMVLLTSFGFAAQTLINQRRAAGAALKKSEKQLQHSLRGTSDALEIEKRALYASEDKFRLIFEQSFLGLVRANPTERLLGKMRSWHKLDGKDGQCHYIGEYCSSKFLGLCLQHKKTFCCFSSPLARIIQEQGRPQSQINISWGQPKTPNCRGFTPTEFQKIDFTKINFSEYFSDITNKQINPAASGIGNATSNAVTKFQQSIKK